MQWVFTTCLKGRWSYLSHLPKKLLRPSSDLQRKRAISDVSQGRTTIQWCLVNQKTGDWADGRDSDWGVCVVMKPTTRLHGCSLVNSFHLGAEKWSCYGECGTIVPIRERHGVNYLWSWGVSHLIWCQSGSSHGWTISDAMRRSHTLSDVTQEAVMG